MAAEVASAFGFGHRYSGSKDSKDTSTHRNDQLNDGRDSTRSTIVLTSEKTSFSSVKGWSSSASLSNKRYYGSLPVSTEDMVEKVRDKGDAYLSIHPLVHPLIHLLIHSSYHLTYQHTLIDR